MYVTHVAQLLQNFDDKIWHDLSNSGGSQSQNRKAQRGGKQFQGEKNYIVEAWKGLMSSLIRKLIAGEVGWGGQLLPLAYE
jgi:hypothetical protein